MSGQHTPGPWRVSGPSKVISSISDGGDYAILDDTLKIIAEAIHRVGPTEYRPAEANAHLIAAAPELLEEAQYSLDLIAGLQGSFDDGSSEGKHYERVLADRVAKLRAAIAKARGDAA